MAETTVVNALRSSTSSIYVLRHNTVVVHTTLPITIIDLSFNAST